MSAYQVCGDELLEFSFTTPGLATVDYVFAMDKIVLAGFIGSEKTKQWTLHGVGVEALAAKSVYIQKSYNTDIASMVSDIHTNFLNSTRPLTTDQTNGTQKIIIPNLKPFDAIDMVRRRASSSGNPNSNYLYFENAAGFNFRTIQSMLAGAVVKTFQHVDALATSIYNNTFYNIISYEVPQLFSSSERIDLGSMTQRTAQYDIRTKQYTSQDQTLNGPFDSQSFRNVYGGKFSAFSFLPFDSSSRGNTFLPQSTPLQLASLANLMQCYITMQCYGDTSVMVGQVVNVNIPATGTTTGPKTNDPLISGNYLISRIARHIDLLSVRPRYLETIEGLTSGSS